jgi:hypothetical protein
MQASEGFSRLRIAALKIEGPDIAAGPFGCSGRRDWTRTNDPHHVKVVL